MPHRTASLLKASPEGEGSHPPQIETLEREQHQQREREAREAQDRELERIQREQGDKSLFERVSEQIQKERDKGNT